MVRGLEDIISENQRVQEQLEAKARSKAIMMTHELQERGLIRQREKYDAAHDEVVTILTNYLLKD